jgi:hypothetical protein
MSTSSIPAEDQESWVRVCREHNAICLQVEISPHVDRVICPWENGHVLTQDFQWKVCRRQRPAAHGWHGWRDGEGKEP